jgi:transglutaminase-like putative cysteine protease
MRYRLRHATNYSYGAPVDHAAHLAHLHPRVMAHQSVAAEILRADPPGRRRGGHDHFGNRVSWLFLDEEHASIEIVTEAVIDVAFPAAPPTDATPAWEAVAARALTATAWEPAEFRFDSPLAPADPDATAYVRLSFPAATPILAGLLDLNRRINADFAYRPGMTSVSTPVAEVMRRRLGVCQDFAHVMISGLRGLGLPARYVSGYVRTLPSPGQARLQGADQSHAWVGCWLGPELGWVDLDPTNALVVTDQHVVLGWGRDFSDVSPLRGVILGGGAQTLAVSVDLEPVDI